ncbi:MAG: glycosyltransferase [Planctomycetales bacterium]|nr:glycosyltransferase [Planctomycetales bacterium]
MTHSLSRLGGGIPAAMQRLYVAASGRDALEVDVLGLADCHSQEDAAAWSPLSIASCAVRGPAAVGYSPELQQRLATSDPDLVHTHGCWKYTSAHVLHWGRATDRPYVVSPHGMIDRWALQNSRWKKRIAGRWFEWAHLKEAACLHALTEAEATSIRDLGLSNPICIIPNGVDPVRRSGDAASAGAPRPTVLFLGRLHPKKGLSELIAAWSQFARRHSDWRLQIAGWDDGGHEEALRSATAAAGVNGSVEFCGPQFGAAKASLLAAATAFILPSHSEGLPMTILEAWAAGVPVIMTPQCNLPEGFAAGAAAAIEPTVDSISDGLTRFAQLDEASRREMGERGRTLVRERFNWPDIASEVTAVYRWLLGKGDQPASVRL